MYTLDYAFIILKIARNKSLNILFFTSLVLENFTIIRCAMYKNLGHLFHDCYTHSNVLHHHHHHQCVLPKGRSFTANSDTKAAVLPKGRSSTPNSGTKLAVVLGMNRCGSFPLFSAPHSLFSTWINLKRSGKIPGTPAWKWGEWIWLIGPSGLHRNSLQGLNISSIKAIDQINDPEFNK